MVSRPRSSMTLRSADRPVNEDQRPDRRPGSRHRTRTVTDRPSRAGVSVGYLRDATHPGNNTSRGAASPPVGQRRKFTPPRRAPAPAANRRPDQRPGPGDRAPRD
jgi:hypothetical protein